MSAAAKSALLREEGNVLYKSGQLLKAVKKYQEAVKLSPDDPTPLGNLSAAYFEVGKYTQCITRAEKALELLQVTRDLELSQTSEDETASSDKITKFEQRIAKAKVHSDKGTKDEQKYLRNLVLNLLPKYRPLITFPIEYYTVGHDTMASQFDASIEKSNSKDEVISFFFGGIGDARHLYRTITHIAEFEMNGSKQAPTRRYHFTIHDINKCAITRDLIILMLLEDLSRLDHYSDEALIILTTLYYTYISPMMPRYAFDQLHKTIDRALDCLKSGRQPIELIFLHNADFPRYI